MNLESLFPYFVRVAERFFTIWLIDDGKPGHQNQSLGLAAAMQRLVACKIHRISIAGEGGIVGRIRAAFAQSADLSKPDFIIAAGHATHLAMLCLARKHRAKSIVLMRPSLPLRCFDLCIAPLHDFPKMPSRKNLILTRGAINRVHAKQLPKAGRLILIGGPSKIHGWDTEAMLEMLTKITADDRGWQLTDSRRTPVGFLKNARMRLKSLEIFSCQQTPPDWLPSKLREADEVWVSEDSVSMIHEALSSGARVGLLSVPRLKPSSRVLRGIDELVGAGYLTPFSAWQKDDGLPRAPEILNEAERCARLVLGR